METSDIVRIKENYFHDFLCPRLKVDWFKNHFPPSSSFLSTKGSSLGTCAQGGRSAPPDRPSDRLPIGHPAGQPPLLGRHGDQGCLQRGQSTVQIQLPLQQPVLQGRWESQHGRQVQTEQELPCKRWLSMRRNKPLAGATARQCGQNGIFNRNEQRERRSGKDL